MPIYCYQCDACGHAAEEFQSIHDDSLSVCPSCGAAGYHRVPTLPHTDMKEYQKPIEMHSVAFCYPDEVSAFKRNHPDIEISDDLNHPLFGVPIARTRKQKLEVLKSAGFMERT